MKLYYHPVSTTSRPVVLFATESGIELDYEIVDLFTGAQYQPEYAAINPSRQVPVLEDGDFRLTESSAILKYLADKIGSAAYPSDLRKRARVNERMDWLNTGFYRDFSYGFLYPQIFPFMRRPDDNVQAGTVAWGTDKALTWLKVLDEGLIGPRNAYLCGDDITLADYLGSMMLLGGEAIECRFDAYPNISRWLRNMKALKSWDKVNEPSINTQSARTKARNSCASDVVPGTADGAALLAATRSALPVAPLDRLRKELAARQQRRVRMVGSGVRHVALVIGDAEELPADPANTACIGLHASAACPGPTGGISCAVGLACFNACRQIFVAKTHIARTSSTKKAQTNASR
jgi:glutathione S-transferase